jgi:ATP-dependent helicase/DNAse subunit B
MERPLPLTLVTGPANSAKAQVVLERYRAALERSPILVVPRSADAEYYRRELAGAGVVLGVRVEPFGGLMRELSARAGVGTRVLGGHAREALIGAVVAATQLEALGYATRGPAFSAALARFIAELEARRVEPQRLTAALRSWAASGSRRRAYADDLAALYTGYRRRLARLGRLDAELHALEALDALVLAPERWGTTAVFLYGFDDLEPLQLNVVETLAHKVGAPVVLSLPAEPGRVALAGRAGTLETLRPAADEVVELQAQATYYEQPQIHHLERFLFEPAPARIAAGDAVALLEGGDQRAEAELVAQEIAGLLAEGFRPGEIAIVTRRGGGEPFADALSAFAIPYSRARRAVLGASAIGAGLGALLRCARGGEAADLIGWLRLTGADGVDELEAWVRRSSSGALAPARERWERRHGGRLDDLRAIEVAAASSDVGGLLGAVGAALETLLAAPFRRAAAMLDPWEAAASAAVRRVLAELAELARGEPGAAGGISALAETLGRTTVELAGASEESAVSICDALSLRARRVRALFICSVQDGEFPAATVEPPFLGSAERAELAQASGLLLGLPPDQLAAERYLFYALCSRPTARLRVSWHAAGEDGDPTPASLFVEDLRDCFTPELYEARRTRAAGQLRWDSPPPGLRPLERLLDGPRRDGARLGALRLPANLAALRSSPAYSASALERWADCPVGWLVDRGLRAKALEPDSVPQLRGSKAHELLASVFERLREQSAGARLDATSLPLALELLDEALAASDSPISPQPAGDATERRRLSLDLTRYLTLSAESPGSFEPTHFEIGFGIGEDAEFPAVELPGGLLLRGRIDRVDIDPTARQAIVIDYKTGSDAPPLARWLADRRLQQALYMRVAERLLAVEAVGGLYQPLRKDDLRPRGALTEDAEPQGPEPVSTDRVTPGELRAVIDELVDLAGVIAAELENGAIEARPTSCTRRGGCMFPTICRCEYV